MDIKGRVLNEKDQPLTGASVTIKGTRKAIITNERGNFELKNVSPGTELEISYTGYIKRKIETSTNRFIVIKLSKDILK